MVFSNQTYDKLKWMVLIFMPALCVLLTSIGDLYIIANMERYVQTVNCITVFVGTLLQISSHHYYEE